jgi:hypothetical protein
MGFIGRLADMPFTDLVQMLSMSKRSGKLTLTEATSRAALVFRTGDIIAASREPPRYRLGDTLLKLGLITEANLELALNVQRELQPAPLIGAILIDLGAVSPDTLRSVVQEQIQEVLSELVSWENGSFKFEPMPLSAALERELEGKELVVPDGLRAEQVVLEALRRRDELVRDIGGSRSSTAALPRRRPGEVIERPTADGFSPAQLVDLLLQAQRRQPGDGTEVLEGGLIAVLKSIMEEGRGARTLSEVGLLILRCAAAIVSRGLLLRVDRGSIRGMGQFGLRFADSAPNRRVGSLRFSLTEPSMFADAVANRHGFRGEVPLGKVNDAFLDLLGGMRPTEAVVVPVVVDGETQLLFYGDNLPERAKIGGVEILEMLALYAGIEMEKAKLVKVADA